MKKFGLRSQAIAFCVLLLVSATGLLSSLLIWRSYASSMDGLQHHALVHTHTIARACDRLLDPVDAPALQAVLEAAATDRDLLLSYVLDAEGNRVAQFGAGAREPNLDSAELARLQTGSSQGFVGREGDQIVAVLPIWSSGHKPIGFVWMAYSAKTLFNQLAEQIQQVAILALAIIAAGTALTVYAVHRLIVPVNELADAAKSIAAGDLTRRACSGGPAEVGVLAQAFNQMADALARYTDSLENKVEESTKALEASKQELQSAAVMRDQTEAELERAKVTAESANRELLETSRELDEASRELQASMERVTEIEVAAEASQRARSEFLADMSHNCRTLMTSVMGFAESLREATLPESDRDNAVATIKRNGEHLLVMMNNLLDIAEIETGKFQVNHDICSVFEEVAEVEALVEPRAREKGLSFDIDYIGEMPDTIQTDRSRLRQILLNLADNAVTYTEVGGVRLVVEFSDESLEPVMQFEVIDTGLGMSEEKVAALFEPFGHRPNTARSNGGTGLGLSICKQSAGLLGGDLTVDSMPDQGSTFRLTIATGPLDGVEMVDGQAKAETVRNQRLAGALAQAQEYIVDARILLAEDGPDNQRLISFMLRKSGMDVTVAENGKVAMEKVLVASAENAPFDLILMDMQMPVLDGYAATRGLREQGFAAPIIALTAHAMAGDREKCLEAGCDDYTTKPIDRVKLVGVIEHWLRKAEANATS